MSIQDNALKYAHCGNEAINHFAMGLRSKFTVMFILFSWNFQIVSSKQQLNKDICNQKKHKKTLNLALIN